MEKVVNMMALIFRDASNYLRYRMKFPLEQNYLRKFTPYYDTIGRSAASTYATLASDDLGQLMPTLMVANTSASYAFCFKSYTDVHVMSILDFRVILHIHQALRN